MAVTFLIPGYLATFAKGQRAVALGGSPRTVQDALESLWTEHPGLRDRIVDEQGAVRQHINVFVAGESIRFAGGLATPVPEGAEILVVPAVSGGKR